VRSRAVLPNVERRLTSLARKRTAEAKRRRRRGPGFAIIAFAGLAIGGSALAATGVWNPLGEDHHRVQLPAQSSELAEVQSGFARGVPVLPGERQGEPGRPGALGRPDPLILPDPGTTTPQTAAAPVVDQDGGADAGGGPPPNGAEPDGPPGIGGAQPKEPGASPGDGGGNPKDPGKGGNGPQTDPPDGPNGSPSPRSAPISVFCEGLRETQPNTFCFATVVGEASVPTGQVSFEAAGPNQFEPPSCTLRDLGDGTTSRCSVGYSLLSELPVEAVARYGGDTLNPPSSTNFVISFR
jgi:hypothetical protein